MLTPPPLDKTQPTRLADLKRVVRHLESHGWQTYTESDRSCNRAHWKIRDAAVTVAKKSYFSTTSSATTIPNLSPVVEGIKQLDSSSSLETKKIFRVEASQSQSSLCQIPTESV